MAANWSSVNGLARKCTPGSSTACVVVDHVLLDTGSIGLRVFRGAVASLGLPALNLPADGGAKVIDCFYNREGRSDFGAVDDAHRALVEQVVEVDAAFVDRYLTDGDVDGEEINVVRTSVGDADQDFFDGDDLVVLEPEGAEGGSFAEAARHMSLTPAAVGKSVAKLEARLGVRLFQRSTRRLTLTEAGERFLHSVSGGLEQVQKIGRAHV